MSVSKMRVLVEWCIAVSTEEERSKWREPRMGDLGREVRGRTDEFGPQMNLDVDYFFGAQSRMSERREVGFEGLG